MRPSPVWSVLVSTVSVAVAALIVATGPSPAQAHSAPITYSFVEGIRAELGNPGGSLPGTNDFDCRPTARHPRPIMLLHGSGGGRQSNWATLAAVFVREGYCVFAPTYGRLATAWPASAIGGLGPKLDSAWDVKLFAEAVLSRTQSPRLDVVGHSLGTEIPTYWMKYLGGLDAVAHYVSLAPYWRQGPDEDDARGEAIAAFRKRLGVPESTRPDCPECTAPPENRDFNRAVRLPTPYLPGVRYTNVVTRHDEIVTPYTAGLLDGPGGTDVTNVVVQSGCPQDRSDHMSITANRRSAAIVLNALDPDHPRPVPCVPVAPFTGG